MHELSIIENLIGEINKVAEVNKLQKITVVKLRIGRLRQVVPEMLQFAFTQVVAGTKAEKAELIVEQIPVTVQCSDCHSEFTLAQNDFSCQQCGSAKLEILTGKEVVLESISGQQ